MNPHKLLRIVLLLGFGLWYFCELYIMAKNDFMFDGLLLIFIATCGIGIYMWTVIKDFQEYYIAKDISSYSATVVGFVLFLINLGLFCFQDIRMNSASLINGYYDGGFNGFRVDFKKDGRYVMANGSGLGQSYFYGTYIIKDSIISLDVSNVDNCIKTNILIVRRIKEYGMIDNGLNYNNSHADYIIQVDSVGRVIDNEFKFRVTEDNRKLNE